jgi:tetratricopeptide (TPR) repeat protein
MSTHFMNEHNRPENPYKAGNSVGNSPAFVGRDDILKEVERVVRHPDDHAIVLYGQRRIGKTSVLRELEAKLPKDIYCPVFFDLQDRAQPPLDFILRELAHKISDVLHQDEPDLGSDPEVTFRKVWLPEVLNNLPQSLVLLFDEFDVLANPNDEKAGAAFFPYLRELLEIDHRRLNFVFVIGRKIDDLSNIVLSLFKGTPSKHVSLLDREETFKLVRLSETNNTLQWTEETIEKIWQQAGGHPYLTQRWCSRVWDNIYDKSPAKLPVATLEDVEMALPDAYKTSHGTIAWLWDGLPPAEKVVASALAGAGAKAISEAQLKMILKNSGVRMMGQSLQNAPRTLQDWDLIEPANGGYRFRVELLRRWIAEYKPLSKVQEELDHIEPVADSLYKAAQKLYTNHRFDEALTILQQAVNFNSNHVGANLLLADILLVKGKPKKAYQILERLHTLQDNNVIREKLAQAKSVMENANSKLTKTKQKMRNPFIHGSPLMPDQLIGRKRELRQVVGRIITGQSAIITGSPRSGKTSLLRSLSATEYAAEYFGDEADNLIFSYWDACTCDPEFTQTQFWERILKPLKEASEENTGNINHSLLVKISPTLSPKIIPPIIKKMIIFISV